MVFTRAAVSEKPKNTLQQTKYVKMCSQIHRK